MKKILWIAALFAATLSAQDAAGDWQGTITRGTSKLRLVFHITKDSEGGWKSSLFSVDQGTDGIPATSITLQGSALKIKFDAIGAAYEGKIGDGSASIQGTWTQGPPLPLELIRATKETAWRAANYQVHFLHVENVASKDVKLEVVDWGGPGRPLVMLAGLGNTAHTFEKFAPKLAAK